MKQILWMIVIGVIFLIRIMWYESHHVSHIPPSWYETKQTVSGSVVRDPDRGIDRIRVVLNHDDYGRILVTLPTGIQIEYGNTITVRGTIKKPEPFETETQRIFNYPKYLAVSDIYATMRADHITIDAHDQGNPIISLLYRIKYSLVSMMRQLLDPAPAALLAGIVVGEQSLFPKETLNNFQLAGLTHIIVLSGYNITLVANFFITITAQLGFGYHGRRASALVGIPLFIIMTGMGTSLIRAGIMSMIGIILQLTLRPDHSFRVILLTAGAMIFENPRIALHSPSFHLSFLAFIGLVYVVPLVQEKIQSLPAWYGIRNIVFETLAIQAVVMPYIIWMNGRVSLISIIANVITVPLISLVMAGGFIGVIIAFVLFSLGSLIIAPINLGLVYVIWVSEQVARFTTVSVVVQPFSIWWMIGMYGSMVVLISYFYKNYVYKPYSKTTIS